jgi:hypothetical protein
MDLYKEISEDYECGLIKNDTDDDIFRELKISTKKNILKTNNWRYSLTGTFKKTIDVYFMKFIYNVDAQKFIVDVLNEMKSELIETNIYCTRVHWFDAFDTDGSTSKHTTWKFDIEIKEKFNPLKNNKFK